ncbi:MAG TPA: hypothetical protein EYH34_19490 [Planctomycetes bacterium]|nr:hypothetical protein [Planctomycetota bacterium]
MQPARSHWQTLLELEARHEEVLRQLDELDRRVEQVLKECLASARGPGPSGPARRGDAGEDTPGDAAAEAARPSRA